MIQWGQVEDNIYLTGMTICVLPWGVKGSFSPKPDWQLFSACLLACSQAGMAVFWKQWK